MAEQKKNEAMNANANANMDGGPPDHHGIPKQTVSPKILILSKYSRISKYCFFFHFYSYIYYLCIQWSAKKKSFFSYAM